MTPQFYNKFNLYFVVDEAEKLKLSSDFSALYNEYETMGKWFDDPNVPMEEKEKYKDQLLEAMQSMSFLIQLLERCGITEDEIQDWMKIPF